jgi:hypothetical protein
MNVIDRNALANVTGGEGQVPYDGGSLGPSTCNTLPDGWLACTAKSTGSTYMANPTNGIASLGLGAYSGIFKQQANPAWF